MRAGTGPSLIGLLVAALLLAACSSTADPTTSVPTTTTSTTAVTTTTTTVATTTTSSLPEGTVGDPALLAERIRDGSIGLEAEFGVDPATLPIPDLTNPDPLVAMREIIDFDLWVFSNAPRRALVEIYAVDRSPEWEDLVLAADRVSPGRFQFAEGTGLTVSELGYADEELTELIPTADRDDAPDGSVYAYYIYSVDPFEILGREGEVLQNNPGWTDRLVIAVLSPTAWGWALYWEEGQD